MCEYLQPQKWDHIFGEPDKAEKRNTLVITSTVIMSNDTLMTHLEHIIPSTNNDWFQAVTEDKQKAVTEHHEGIAAWYGQLVLEKKTHGWYSGGGEHSDITLPRRWVPFSSTPDVTDSESNW